MYVIPDFSFGRTFFISFVGFDRSVALWANAHSDVGCVGCYWEITCHLFLIHVECESGIYYMYETCFVILKIID